MEEVDSLEISVSVHREEQQEAALPLPAAFLDFLSENGLDPAVYSMAAAIPRYIRLKPGMESHVAEIESELKCCLEKVSWLPGFFATPPEIQIAGSKAYQQGKIYGIDAASAAAILALYVQPGDHVLDLCAAPGLLALYHVKYSAGTSFPTTSQCSDPPDAIPPQFPLRYDAARLTGAVPGPGHWQRGSGCEVRGRGRGEIRG